MTIRKLKEMIADLPDDMRVYADDGTDFFKGNSEFLCIAASEEFSMAVFQTRNDFEPIEETEAMLQYFSEHDEWNEVDAWLEFYDRGYKPEDFADSDWARENMENYGLM